MAAWLSHVFESTCHSEADLGSSRSCQPAAGWSDHEHCPARGRQALPGTLWPAECHSALSRQLTPRRCCEAVFAVLNTCSQEDLTVNNVPFKTLARSPVLLLFRTPCCLYQGHVLQCSLTVIFLFWSRNSLSPSQQENGYTHKAKQVLCCGL